MCVCKNLYICIYIYINCVYTYIYIHIHVYIYICILCLYLWMAHASKKLQGLSLCFLVLGPKITSALRELFKELGVGARLDLSLEGPCTR